MTETDLVRTKQTIIGTQDEVAMALRTSHARGRLLTDPATIKPTRTVRGQLVVQVDMLMPRQPAPVQPWAKRHEVLAAVTKALAFGLGCATLAVAALVTVFELGFHAIGAATLGKAFGVAVGLMVLATVLYVASTGSGHSGHKGEGFHWSKCK